MPRQAKVTIDSEDEVRHDQEEEDEEEYDENADEDFNPEQDGADGGDDASSSSDEDGKDESAAKRQHTKPSGRKGKKRKAAPAHDANDELDSGDEATIRERQKKKRRKGETGTDAADGDNDDDSGDEGGLIKTRAQRLAEQSEKKQKRRRVDGEVTIDVDSLWADLSAIPVGRPAAAPPPDVTDVAEADKENIAEGGAAPPSGKEEDGMITIKRRIEYAGEVTEVVERVARSSKEAKAYLAEHPEADADPVADSEAAAAEKALRRPLRRPSMFEPNPTATVKGVAPDRLRPRAPSRLDVLMAAKRAEEERKKKAQRMTTVQKSALDWRGFVDSEGLRDELDEYGKSKRGFLAREAFLDRAAGARESAAREARLKG